MAYGSSDTIIDLQDRLKVAITSLKRIRDKSHPVTGPLNRDQALELIHEIANHTLEKVE